MTKEFTFNHNAFLKKAVISFIIVCAILALNYFYFHIKWVSEIALFLIIGGAFSSTEKYSKGRKGLQNIIGSEGGLTIKEVLYPWDKIEIKDNKFKIEVGDSDYSYHYQHYNDDLKKYIEENKSRFILEKLEREA